MLLCGISVNALMLLCFAVKRSLLYPGTVLNISNLPDFLKYLKRQAGIQTESNSQPLSLKTP